MASTLVAGIPSSAVFSGYTGSAIWTLIPALFFGFVLQKTGLGKRIAYLGMKSTRLTYPGILFMWAVIGVILSALTPSIVVRVVIVTPIALSCVNICNLSKGSKGRSLILLTAWSMALIPGTGWLTGSLTGPILNGFFTSVPDLSPISFYEWSLVGLLPAILISFMTVLGGYLILKPGHVLNLSREVFAEEYKKLGPVTRNEKITSIILIAAFTMFVTNTLHNIPDSATCLAAWFLLTAAGIIRPDEISTGISWDLVLFIGSAAGMSAVLTASGVSGWISSIIVTALSPVTGSPWLFVYTVLIIMFILRFFDIATFVPTMAILTPVLPQVASAYGINPLVWIPLISIAINAFFMSYQNMFALVAEASLADKGWKPKHFTAYGTVYFIASLLAMVVTIPYWISIGMF